MAFSESNYTGDDIYSIDCTGDACAGDEVCFEKPTFTGYFKNAKFAGFERISGKIIRDSYGIQKQQHTFTLETEKGEIIRIKGRNLYKNKLYRKPWENEKNRVDSLKEKHNRGNSARADRDLRVSQFIDGLIG